MKREALDIRTADGVCPAAVLHPDGAGPWPGVILYPDAGGLRPAMEEIAGRIAAHGYLVLVPDVFYRLPEREPVDFGALIRDRPRLMAFIDKVRPLYSTANVIVDAAALLAHLACRADVLQPRVGVTGYCMGGNRALHVAAAYPERIAAAASYHGGGLATDAPDSPHLGAARIKARVYVAGAVEDANFTDAMKERLAAALAAAGVDHTVETYAGMRHGWVVSDMPVYDAAGARRHDETLLALFDATLR